jgi:hypothetical protein
MNRYFIITLLILFPLTLQSQNRYGVTAALTTSTFSDGFFQNTFIDSNFGYYVGVFYEQKLNDYIVFRPKAIITLQGDLKKDDIRWDNKDDVIDYKLLCLNFPMNFKFFSKPYVFIGPQFGVLLNTIKLNYDFGDPNKFDFGVNFGFGTDIKNKFFIELSSYQGFIKVIEVNDFNATNTIIIQLGLGYRFK